MYLQFSSTLWWLPHLNFWLTLKAWHVPTCSFRQNSFRKASLSGFPWQQILPKFVLYGYFSGQNAKIKIKRFAEKKSASYVSPWLTLLVAVSPNHNHKFRVTWLWIPNSILFICWLIWLTFFILYFELGCNTHNHISSSGKGSITKNVGILNLWLDLVNYYSFLFAEYDQGSNQKLVSLSLKQQSSSISGHTATHCYW